MRTSGFILLGFQSSWMKMPVFLLMIIMGLLMIEPIELAAQGDLLITPRRIVFEGDKQREEITLANTGQDTSRYTVSFVQYRMTEHGSFEQIIDPDPGQLFADQYVRFFPRAVTLAPGEAQVVRMQLRKPSDLAPGEYRSHIYFRAVPEERPLGEDELTLDTAAIGIRLTPIFGITIPVIIRHGDLNAEVSIDGVALQYDAETGYSVTMNLHRTGNKSVFGDLYLWFIGSDGLRHEIGLVRGIAVYTPNSIRQFTMPVQMPEGLDPSVGMIMIRYSGGSDTGRKVYDEVVIDIQ